MPKRAALCAAIAVAALAVGVPTMASAVTTFEFDAATGAMKEIDMASALPAGFNGKSTGAEIQIDAAGASRNQTTKA